MMELGVPVKGLTVEIKIAEEDALDGSAVHITKDNGRAVFQLTGLKHNGLNVKVNVKVTDSNGTLITQKQVPVVVNAIGAKAFPQDIYYEAGVDGQAPEATDVLIYPTTGNWTLDSVTDFDHKTISSASRKDNRTLSIVPKKVDAPIAFVGVKFKIKVKLINGDEKELVEEPSVELKVHSTQK